MLDAVSCFYGYFLVVKPPIPYVPRHFYTDEIVLDAVSVSVYFLVVKPPISYVPHNLYTGEIVLDARALAEAGAPQSFALTRKGKPEKGEVTLGASFTGSIAIVTVAELDSKTPSKTSNWKLSLPLTFAFGV